MENVERKETIEKLVKVLVSDEFEEKMDSVNSMEDILAALKDEGVEVTEEELRAFFDSANGSESDDDSLSEEDLEAVAGGGLIGNWIKKQVNKVKQSIGYFFGGGYVTDIMTGKKKHPWLKY